ncbi:MAG: hypothetical protein ACRDI2_13235, partial [Chloroflexota bacterium]
DYGMAVRYATTAPTLVLRPAPNPALPHNGTSEWVRVRDTFYTPPEVTGGVLQLIWTVNAGGTAWLDDLRVCKGDSCDAGTVPALPTATLPACHLALWHEGAWLVRLPDGCAPH